MALPVRKGYTGNGVQSSLTSSPTDADTTFTVAAKTGWPTTFPFFVVVDPGTSKEEKMRVTGISTLTLTVARGVDNTTAVAHTSGAVIYPVFTASEADEANQVASAMTTKGDLIATDGSTINRLAVGATNTHVLQVDSTATNGFKWAQVATAGIADTAVSQAKLASSLSAVTVTTSSLLSTAIPSPFNGQVAYETDTRHTKVYDGSAWRFVSFASQYKVGDTGPGGGTIFFVDRFDEYSGFNYLEIAPDSTRVLRPWAQSSPTNYQTTSVTGADGKGLGTGSSNTTAIVAQGNSNAATCAATYCDSLTSGGQSDWYLGSLAEMKLANEVLHQSLETSWYSGYYWTSTQADNSNAFYMQAVAIGSLNATLKSTSLEVRPIRKFS